MHNQLTYKQKPGPPDTWAIVRAQALLIAENGNLLLLRPPRNEGEETWMERATALRTTAAQLAKAATAQEYERCRVEFKELANACNRCHQFSRINVRIAAFADRFAAPDAPLTPAAPKLPPVPKAPEPPKPMKPPSAPQ